MKSINYSGDFPHSSWSKAHSPIGGVHFTCSKFKLTAMWYKAVLFDKCYCVFARVYMSVMFIYTYKYTYNMAMLGIF